MFIFFVLFSLSIVLLPSIPFSLSLPFFLSFFLSPSPREITFSYLIVGGGFFPSLLFAFVMIRMYHTSWFITRTIWDIGSWWVGTLDLVAGLSMEYSGEGLWRSEGGRLWVLTWYGVVVRMLAQFSCCLVFTLAIRSAGGPAMRLKLWRLRQAACHLLFIK